MTRKIAATLAVIPTAYVAFVLCYIGLRAVAVHSDVAWLRGIAFDVANAMSGFAGAYLGGLL